jgi:hypothetical protein
MSGKSHETLPGNEILKKLTAKGATAKQVNGRTTTILGN